MKFYKISLIILIIPMFFSCVRHKNLVYMQNEKIYQKDYILKKNIYIIKDGDNLDIKFSSTDPATSAILNKETGINNTNMQNATSLYISSYSVDNSGNIQVPLIGEIYAKGLTIQQLNDTLVKRLEDILNIKSVTVRISNFRVSVLGEVKNPSTFYIYNDEINILQALSYAGDLSDMGNRGSIKIIRNDNTNQKAKVIIIDLTDANFISSEAYYLLPNDVIYVDPIKPKASRINLPVYQIIVSSVTAILVLFNLLNNSF